MLTNERKYTVNLNSIQEEHLGIVGATGDLVGSLKKLDVAFPHGFIITTDAFDNFIVANDLVNPILEQLSVADPTKMSVIEKVSSNIEKLFRDTVMPPSIYDPIRQEYERIVGKSNGLVSIRPSWIKNLVPFSGGTGSKYKFTNISSLHDLEKRIALAWQALFDPNAILERAENAYDKELSIALVVERMLNSEVSGHAYSYNPLTHNEHEVEIEAVFGLLDGIDELELTPDRYVLNKDGERIVEKNTVAQKSMLVKNSKKDNEGEPDMEVNISSQWQFKQKVSDKILQDLTVILKTIEEETKQLVELDWAVETGRIYITDIRFAKPRITQDLISYKSHITTKITHTSEDEEKDSTPKSIDMYVKEIEDEIENLHNDFEKAQIITPEPVQLAEEIEIVKPQKKKLVAEKVSKIEPENTDIWEGINLNEGRKVDKGVLDIALDLTGDFDEETLNTHEFDGFYGLYGEIFLENFAYKLTELSNPEIGEYKQFVIDEISKLMSYKSHPFGIYSLSNLNYDQAQDFVDSTKTYIDLHLKNDFLIDIEIEIVKQLRNKYKFRNLWFSVRDLVQVDDFKVIKKVLNISGLRRTSSFKLFVELTKIPAFLEAQRYIDLGADGIVLHLDEIVDGLLGRKVSVNQILDNEILWDKISELSTRLHSHDGHFIVVSELLHSKNGDDILLKLMKYGVTSVVTPHKGFEKFKKELGRLELKVLEG